MSAGWELSVGLLDFGLCPAGVPQAEAIVAIVERAVRADQLGFSCYWLGEHYDEGVCYASPSTLVPVLAGMTEKIRVGAAAHLLAAHNPARLAADYSTYESLFPGRIDCGVGAGGPTAVPEGLVANPELTHADRFAILAGLLLGELPSGHLHLPPRGLRPQLWSMGAGGSSLDLALQTGAAYSHACWLSSPAGHERFRRVMHERGGPGSPRLTNVAVSGICAPTEAEAMRQAAASSSSIRPDFVGDSGRCLEWLRDTGLRFGVHEVVFLDLSVTAEARMRTIELLADTIRS